MRFAVLGSVSIERDGRHACLPRSQRRGLLAYLLLHANRLVTVESISEALWGGAAPATATAQVRSAIHAIRTALRDLGDDAALISGATGYGIRIGRDRLDASMFEDLVEHARGVRSAEAVRVLREALALWRGPALADASGAFVEAARSRLDDQRVAAVEELAALELARGNVHTALSEIQPALEIHPLRERLREQHMLALYRSGRQTEALDSFRALRARLAQEHGLDPGRRLMTLHQRILQADRSLDQGLAGQAIKVRRRAGHLPAETTGFVGREEELAAVTRLVRRSRLVTLTGVGGVGKTRLAIRLGWELNPSFPDGVWHIDLSSLLDSKLLVETVRKALGVADRTTRPPVDVLTDHLSDKRALLILDTCEHLIGGCAELVESLLRAAPRLRILSTSREPLALPGEQVFVVHPMTRDAVTLFAERAKEANQDFALTERNRAAVARLCERLDGIPLALELAAVRLRLMSVQQLLDRLDERFTLLDGSRTGLSRHQTLRTAIGWSHRLCLAEERLLWARLSVFPGSFDLGSAEAVCADDRLPRQDVRRALAGLVDKSIVLPDRDPEVPRFRLLDTIAEYGRSRLREVGDEEETLRRHRDHFLELALRLEPEWFGPDQIGWHERMLAEHANIRAALEFSLTRPEERRAALELATSLWPWWQACGLFREGRRYLERALRGDTQASAQRAEALWTCGLLAAAQGDEEAVRRLAADCRRLVHGDHDIEVLALHLEGVAATLGGDMRGATAATGRAIARHVKAKGRKPQLLLILLIARAFALLYSKEHDAAMEIVEEHRAIADVCGDVWTRSWGDDIASQVKLAQGELAAATAFAAASLEACARFQDALGLARCVDVLADVSAAAGDGARAARLLAVSQVIWREAGRPQVSWYQLRPSRDQCEARSRSLIGHREFETVYSQASAMTMEEAISWVLHDHVRPREASVPGVAWSRT